MNIINEPLEKDWPALLKRPQVEQADLSVKIGKIFREIEINGDEALRSYTLEFDKVEIESFLVSKDEIANAVDTVPPGLKEAIQTAKRNIDTFHKAQVERMQKIETMPGVHCWRKAVAIQKVGLYIPAGSAPLFSSLLMLGIPALIAGCKDIIVCTPPGKDGNANATILYAAGLLGINKIYKAGGAQAIAGMVWGTGTIPKVDKIFGPGNQYVTAAKQLASRLGTAIDMPAGPSELAVYADSTCIPAFVAADLLSQAEHGPDSQVVLIAHTAPVAEAIQKEMMYQLELLSRKEIAAIALQQSRFIIINNTATAFNFLNAYAPEHLIIASDDAENLSAAVINAGSVFLGHYSPESAGDYASGTNHTLPTNGYAKTLSGVSVDSFVKKITFQQLTQTGIRNLGSVIQSMAMAEGLDGHAAAVMARIENLNRQS